MKCRDAALRHKLRDVGKHPTFWKGNTDNVFNISQSLKVLLEWHWVALEDGDKNTKKLENVIF